MKTRALSLLFAIVVSWALPAFAADAFTIPPTPDHYVTDTAGALSSTARQGLENELQAYETATGHQLVVYIAPTTGAVPLETWTVETANRWKIGHKGKEDGAVLFVFMKDHKLRIEVGYGLEGKLPDASAFRIITDVITPKMKAGDVDGAITSGVAAMITTITPDYRPSMTPEPDANSSGNMSPAVAGLIGIVVVLFVLFIAFMIVMQIVSSLRYGFLVMREGPAAAARDMRRWWFWSGVGTGIASSGGGWSSGGGGGFSGGGFSAGGGSFGGGGASGGW